MPHTAIIHQDFVKTGVVNIAVVLPTSLVDCEEVTRRTEESEVQGPYLRSEMVPKSGHNANHTDS